MMHFIKVLFMYLCGLYLIVSVGCTLYLWLLLVKEWFERNFPHGNS